MDERMTAEKRRRLVEIEAELLDWLGGRMRAEGDGALVLSALSRTLARVAIEGDAERGQFVHVMGSAYDGVRGSLWASRDGAA